MSEKHNNKQGAGGRALRFGVIGTGAIFGIMRPGFLGESAARVVALADVNESAARAEAALLGGGAVFADYREMLAGPDVQAVYIATPPVLHREMVVASLRAGKHVLCEKPFMMNLDEVREVAAVHASCPHLKLASCSSRFHATPPVRRARELIAGGRLGKLLRVRATLTGPPPPPLSSLSPWKQSRRTTGGGVSMDWGVYDLDWFQYLLGDQFDPVAVFANTDFWGREESDLESGFSAEIRTASGLCLHWERRSEHGPQLQRVEVRGTSGGLDLPFMPEPSPRGLTSYQFGAGNTLGKEEVSDPANEGDWPSILQHPLTDFVGAVADDRPPASSLDTQFKIHAVIDALRESASSGQVAMINNPSKNTLQ